ncbi:hypothetical protein [Erwinia tasmaniensis]|nr:hypothetical protein [Erwinia tasmaniensis]
MAHRCSSEDRRVILPANRQALIADGWAMMAEQRATIALFIRL